MDAAAAEGDAAKFPEDEEYPEHPQNVPVSGPGIYRAEFCFTKHLHPGAKRRNARCRWCNNKFIAGPQNKLLQNHLLSSCAKVPLAKKDALRLALASVAAAPPATPAAAVVPGPHAAAAAAAGAPAAAGQPGTGIFSHSGMLEAQSRSSCNCRRRRHCCWWWRCYRRRRRRTRGRR